MTIRIYDFSGRLVKILLDRIHRDANSNYQEPWDGCDGNGNIVSNGVYFYIIETSNGDEALGKVMVLD